MTIFTLRSGGTAHPEESVLQIADDLIASPGVKGSLHFAVSEKSGTPDLSVDVATGRAYVQKASSNTYPVRSSAIENVVVTSNASGNPRIDTAVLYIDLSAAANTDASNVAKLAIVAGTPAASPSAPDDTAIGTAIGAANPFIRLADIDVASGATQILNANITDIRANYVINTNVTQLTETTEPSTPSSENALLYAKADGKLYSKDDTGRERIAADEDWIDLTDQATINIDLSLGKKFRVTLGGNRTFTISNDVTGKTFVLRIKQDGTGSRTATFWANLLWPGGAAPDLSTDPNVSDELGFNILDGGGNESEGFIIGSEVQ